MIDVFELQELLDDLFELDSPPEDYDDLLFNAYGIDFETFGVIIDDLINYTPVLKSPLTGTISHCFGVIENPETGLFRAIIKKDIENG